MTEKSWRRSIVIAFGMIAAGPVGSADPIAYDTGPRKILKKHCVACHNSSSASADLDLSSYAGIVRGSASGEVVVGGDAEESYLYLVTAHLEEPVMPPGDKKIPDDELDILRRWIEGGLVERADQVVFSPSEVTADEDAPAAESIAKTGRSAPLVAIAAHPKQSYVALGIPNALLIVGPTSRDTNKTIPFPNGQPLDVSFSDDGRYLTAAGGQHGVSGTVGIYDTQSWSLVWQSEPQPDAVLAGAMHPQRRQVVFGGTGRIISVVTPPSSTPSTQLDKHSDWVTALSYSPDGVLFASGDRGGAIYIWAAEDATPLYTLRGHKGRITGLEWMKAGDVCVSSSDDGTVRTWDMHTGEPITQRDAHPGGATAMDVAPEGVVTVGRDQTVRSWRSPRLEPLDSHEVASLPTSVASFENSVAVSDYQGTLSFRGAADPAWRSRPADSLAASAQPISLTSTLGALVPTPLRTTQQLVEASVSIDEPAEPLVADERDAITALAARIEQIERSLAELKVTGGASSGPPESSAASEKLRVHFDETGSGLARAEERLATQRLQLLELVLAGMEPGEEPNEIVARSLIELAVDQLRANRDRLSSARLPQGSESSQR